MDDKKGTTNNTDSKKSNDKGNMNRSDSSNNNSNSNNAGDPRRREFDGDNRVPPGSWIQHVQADGTAFWRNNATCDRTHQLYYAPEEWVRSSCCHQQRFIPARPVFTPLKEKEPKKEKDPKKENGTGKENESKGENKPGKPKHFMIRTHQWEELYRSNGSKFWRHRTTRVVTSNDPLW